MPYDPQKHHRRSIRLKGYDYASPGAYFVTICTQDYVCLFGQVVDGEMVLNNAGRMIRRVWETIPQRFPTVQSDLYIIMPNHFHAIITINNPPSRGGDPCGRTDRAGTRRAGTRPAPTGGRVALGDVVGAFKSITTHQYIVGVRNDRWPPFNKRVWQRNYYERIIRDEQDLENIRQYIANNPARWTLDRDHPENVGNI